MSKIWKFLDGKKRNLATVLATAALIADSYGVDVKLTGALITLSLALSGTSMTSQALKNKRAKNDK